MKLTQEEENWTAEDWVRDLQEHGFILNGLLVRSVAVSKIQMIQSAARRKALEEAAMIADRWGDYIADKKQIPPWFQICGEIERKIRALIERESE